MMHAGDGMAMAWDQTEGTDMELLFLGGED